MIAAAPTSTRRDTLTWSLAAGVGVGYLALAQGLGIVSEWLSDGPFDGPVFWPAAGIALGAMLITRRERWPAILAAVFLAEVTSNLLYGMRGPEIVAWGAANVLHPLVAATLIRRFHPRFALRSLPELAALVVFGGVVGPAISATIGTATSVAMLEGTWSTLGGWWAGDGLGALVIAPLFVAYRTPRLVRSPTEVLIGWGALLAVTSLVFRDWDSGIDTVLPYLVLPPLVWAALRLGLRGASVAVAVVGLVGGWSTSLGFGAFAAPSGLGAEVLFQLYLAVLVVTALLIASLVADLTGRDEIQQEAERRQRQQAALAELGRHLLAATTPGEVVDRAADAVRVIAERPERGADTADTVAAAELLAPLAAHPEANGRSPVLIATRVAAEDAALVEAAANQAASALDRLAQAEILQERADDLERLNEQLAQAITFREQLVSMVSHELRSPLTPILGFAEVLRRSLPVDGAGDAPFALDAIERNARRILALIDELLLAARAAEAKVPAHAVVIDVVAVIEEALEHVHDDVPVTCDEAGVHRALIDPGHLSQCVLNLVGNAVKYGGPPVEVYVRGDGDDRVAVEVRDRGAGVPDDLVAILFDRFTQAGGPTPEPGRGVGLGLSIVRTLIERNGGSVAYEPPAGGRPVAFVLRIPRGADESAASD